MGAWLVVLGGGFLLQRSVDRASALLILFAGVYAILWQEPALFGYAPDSFAHVGLAQPVFLFFLSGAIFLWAYWLFQEHVERLETATEDLGNALTMERTLLDILSHDLRNPLHLVHNRLSAAVSGKASLEEHADQIERSLLHIERLIENSVTYSELSSQGDLERERADVRALVDRAVESLQPQADLRGVHLVVHGPQTLGADVVPVLGQAIANLVDNAIAHSPEGEAVAVSLEPTPDQVRISVADQGSGMDPEDHEHLFQRFQQGANGREDGRGLGLAIVRRIVEAHDGRIDIEERSGPGTCIAIELPRYQRTDASSEGPEEPIASPSRPRGVA